MKVLYFGGQKSGKSRLAEAKALEISNSKPYYIATYDNSFGDKEMDKRIQRHQDDREGKFITIEQTKDLPKVIKDGNTYLIDCISMWILNHIETSEEELIEQIEKLSQIDANIVFVLNDVNSGVIPLEYQSRRFVDFTGIVGQKLASICDEVYEVKLGIGVQIK
jgi:adenosylcobinamide kinase/adenosylcobinamide-phosphate guanylyltransferase